MNKDWQFDSSSCDRCYGKRHQWGKWNEKETGKITKSKDNGAVGMYLLQSRECVRCGYKEIKCQTEIKL
jgi:hypothetical protein